MIQCKFNHVLRNLNIKTVLFLPQIFTGVIKRKPKRMFDAFIFQLLLAVFEVC